LIILIIYYHIAEFFLQKNFIAEMSEGGKKINKIYVCMYLILIKTKPHQVWFPSIIIIIIFYIDVNKGQGLYPTYIDPTAYTIKELAKNMHILI
jgi:hypothetical protein